MPWQEGAGMFFPMCARDGRDMLGLLQAVLWFLTFWSLDSFLSNPCQGLVLAF